MQTVLFNFLVKATEKEIRMFTCFQQLLFLDEYSPWLSHKLNQKEKEKYTLLLTQLLKPYV